MRAGGAVKSQIDNLTLDSRDPKTTVWVIARQGGVGQVGN